MAIIFNLFNIEKSADTWIYTKYFSTKKDLEN